MRDELTVYYIKLGQAGLAFQECLERDLLYVGYDSHIPEIRELSNEMRDSKLLRSAQETLSAYWRKQGKTAATATNFVNRIGEVVKDSGKTLWFTIENRKIYYGITAGGPLEPHKPWETGANVQGSAKKMKYGWSDLASDGSYLHLHKISGALTKTQGTRGTMAKIKAGPAKYFIKTLLGEPLQLKAAAEAARKELIIKLAEITRDLKPSEFEVLIDLIFTNSGWKRDGELGGTLKFADVTLRLPSTGETAAVQVKTKTSRREAEEYIQRDYRSQGFDKFFYVYHSGDVIKPKDDDNYFVWGLDEVVEKAIDAGLSQWIIDRAYR